MDEQQSSADAKARNECNPGPENPQNIRRKSEHLDPKHKRSEPSHVDTSLPGGAGESLETVGGSIALQLMAAVEVEAEAEIAEKNKN